MFDKRVWFYEFLSQPLKLVVGVAIVATAATGGALSNVASASLAILFITCLFYARKWPVLWRALSGNEQLLLAGFVLYALSGLISYYNVSDQYEFIKYMGRYIRFILVVPVYLILTKENIQLFKYLLLGSLISGPLYLYIALNSVAESRSWVPATGQYHHIVFGEAAMLNVVFLVAVLFASSARPVMKAIMLISIACSSYACLLSQTRGAWIALPVCVALILFVLSMRAKLKVKMVFPLLLLAVVAVTALPIGSLIEDRLSTAVQEVESFANENDFNTSVGIRLAMWHIALNVWLEHPVIGTGLGDFDREIEARQSQGKYVGMKVNASVHNIYLQALASTGAVGFLVLCFALLIQPIRVFYSGIREKVTPANLGGLVVIVAFAIFGLTESWILRAPVISIYLMYLITLSISASKFSGSEYSWLTRE